MRFLTIKRIVILGLLLSLQLFVIKPLMANSANPLNVTIEVLDSQMMLSGTTICMGDTVILRAIVDDGVVVDSYTWSTTEFTNSIIVDATNTYSIIVEDETGCIGTKSVMITVSEGPEVSIEVNDTFGDSGDNTICKESEVDLTATGGSTYLWDTPNKDETQSIMVSAGNYTVIATDGNGCTGEFMVEIGEYEDPIVTIVVEDTFGDSEDNTICKESEVELTATGGSTYLWDTPNKDETQTIMVSAGNYTVIATDGNGCTGELTVEIGEYEDPIVSIKVNDTFGDSEDNIICQGNEVELTATGGDTYSWSTNESGNSIMVSAGNYTVTATDGNGCTGELTVEIGEYDEPDANFTFVPQNDILIETPIVFTANTKNHLNYSWDFGSDLSCYNIISNETNGSSIEIHFDCDGIQRATLTVTDDNNCMNSSEEILLVENEGVNVFIVDGIEEVECVGAEINPVVEGTPEEDLKDIKWELIENPPMANIDNIITQNASTLMPTLQFSIPGLYILRLTVTQDIINNPDVATAEFTVTVNPNPSLDSYLSLPKDERVICQDEELDIEIDLVEGDFPNYTFTISNPFGVVNEILVNANNYMIEAETDQVGTFEYTILSIEDRNGCRVDNLNQSSITYEVVSIPTIQDVDDSCDSETEFIVSFEIEDGMSPFDITQTIDNGSLSISENTNNFESNPLPLSNNGTEWEYMVKDSNGCQSDSEDGIKTIDDCSGLCFSFSNSIEPDLSDLMLCDNENIEVSIDLTNNGVELRDGQALRFVLINDISQDEMAFSPFMMRNTDNIYNHTFNNLTSGTYFIQVEAGSFNADMMAFTADCSIVTEDSGPFEVFPFPDIESITVNTMCAGDRETEINIALFDAQPIGNYTIFFNNNGGQELTNNNTTIEIETPEDDISYPIDSLVYEINGHRCTSENTDLTVNALDVDVFPLPVINDILINDMSQNGEIGVGEDVKFKATIFDSNPIVDYSWVFDGGDTISTNTIDMIENNFGNPGTVNLDLIVTDENGCTSIFPLEFEVKGGLDCDGMILLPANELSVCFGTLLTISSNEIEVDSNQTVNYLWSVNNILQNGNNDNEFEYSPETNPESGIISNTISVSYTITQGSSLVCESNTDDFLVSVKATPEFEENAFKAFNESPCLNQFTTYILDMKNVADKYEWSVNEINNTTDMPIANIGWNTEGVFELGVVAQNENGCDAEKTIEVVVNNTEAPPYHELFTITRNDTESVIVAYPDSTYCYEWHSSENQEDFINNFNNSDITFSNLEEDQHQFKVFNTSADISEFTWIKVYGDGSNCNGSLNDDCSTNIFYSDSVLTFFAARFTNPDNDNPEIILYPNPNNGQFVIEFQGEFQETVYQLSVYDSRGASLFNKTMVEDDISQSKYQIQLKDLVSGLYYLRITSKNGLDQTKKFVIQK